MIDLLSEDGAAEVLRHDEGRLKGSNLEWFEGESCSSSLDRSKRWTVDLSSIEWKTFAGGTERDPFSNCEIEETRMVEQKTACRFHSS